MNLPYALNSYGGNKQTTENTYYFRKNIFGDVTHVYDEAGNMVASYNYDAWGNCTVNNITSGNVGTLNPFRYRGYYYDNETGFYYLQTRYYDPEICRFISADNIELVPALKRDSKRKYK